MNGRHLIALQYVKNTNGGATKDNFVEDHEPVGEWLWHELVSQGWVATTDDRIHLTPPGEQALKDAR